MHSKQKQMSPIEGLRFKKEWYVKKKKGKHEGKYKLRWAV